MPDTSKMTATEYAAFTGRMSHPVGQQEAEAVEQRACQAVDAAYVNAFMVDLEDVDRNLTTEGRLGTNYKFYGVTAKFAILTVLREGVTAMRARAAVKSADSLMTEAEADRRTCDAVVKASSPPPECCAEPGCEVVATHKYGKTPLCKKHYDLIPF